MAVATVDVGRNLQLLCDVCDSSAVESTKWLRYVRLCVVCVPMCIVLLPPGPCSGAAGRGTELQAGRSRVRFPTA